MHERSKQNFFDKLHQIDNSVNKCQCDTGNKIRPGKTMKIIEQLYLSYKKNKAKFMQRIRIKVKNAHPQISDLKYYNPVPNVWESLWEVSEEIFFKADDTHFIFYLQVLEVTGDF